MVNVGGYSTNTGTGERLSWYACLSIICYLLILLPFLASCLLGHGQHYVHRQRTCLQKKIKLSKQHVNETIYLERYIVARSPNHCCHEKATFLFLFIVAVGVAVNNVKVFSFAMEMQQWVTFALLSNYKIFRVAVNNNRY